MAKKTPPRSGYCNGPNPTMQPHQRAAAEVLNATHRIRSLPPSEWMGALCETFLKAVEDKHDAIEIPCEAMRRLSAIRRDNDPEEFFDEEPDMRHADTLQGIAEDLQDPAAIEDRQDLVDRIQRVIDALRDPPGKKTPWRRLSDAYEGLGSVIDYIDGAVDA